MARRLRPHAKAIARASASTAVLADASPLIALSLIDQLGLLQALFGSVQAAPLVLGEVLTGQFEQGEARLQAALSQGWLQPCTATPAHVSLDWLDPGETQSILQAQTLALSGVTPLLIMDERAGRAAARELGLACAGTAAVIGMAKQRGLIASAANVFEQLLHADFRMAPEVIRTVLARAGERV